MNKKVFLGLVLSFVTACNLAQASERFVPKFVDPWKKSEELEPVAVRIQKVRLYHDFAVKQLSDETSLPKLALTTDDNATTKARQACVGRRGEWANAARLFKEALDYYEAGNFESADWCLSWAIICGENGVLKAFRYWLGQAEYISTHDPHTIMNEILEAISTVPGSPAEYPGVAERLLLIRVITE